MVAPGEDGSYRSTWELRTDGKAIKGGAAYVLIQVGEEPVATPTPAAPVAAPRPVASGSFELGGHIRDLGIPYANQMHYAGMNWVKIQVFFGQGASGIINAAHAGGFKIQLSAIGGAGMTAEPGFEDKYAAWVAELAAAGADAIEVWNEPNIEREWQIGLISPQAYTNLLCKSYNAIKGANGERLSSVRPLRRPVGLVAVALTGAMTSRGWKGSTTPVLRTAWITSARTTMPEPPRHRPGLAIPRTLETRTIRGSSCRRPSSTTTSSAVAANCSTPRWAMPHRKAWRRSRTSSRGHAGQTIRSRLRGLQKRCS